MYLSKSTISGLLLVLTSISGCTTMNTNDGERDEALVRWSQCVDKRTQDYTGTPGRTMDYVSSSCDGHKRDVIATYPRHLERRLDRKLIEKTRAKTLNHMVATTYSEFASPQASEGIETGSSEL